MEEVIFRLRYFFILVKFAKLKFCPCKIFHPKNYNASFFGLEQGEWTSFIDVLALLVFGFILFPNVDGLVDLATIDVFLAYHYSKESPAIVVLADAYDMFDQRCEKSSARIDCCTPALYVWLVAHIFHHESRPVCPLQGHRMCAKKGKANCEQLWAGMVGSSVHWFPQWKEGGAGVLCSCEGFPNIPLMETRGYQL